MRDTPKIKGIPSVDQALDEHIRRVQLRTIQRKSADQIEPLSADIRDFDWDIKDEVPVLCTSVSEVASRELMKGVVSGCSARNMPRGGGHLGI